MVVGINNYIEESGFTDLSYAEDDAKEFAHALEAQHYKVELIIGGKALRTKIKGRLHDLAGSAHGTLIFFFSGHGSAGLKNPQESYLATIDIDGSDIDGTGLSISDVQGILKDSPAARKMMFLDACRDGAPSAPAAIRAKSKLPGAMQRLAGSTGLRVLYSTAPGKRSYEDDTLHHGIFTKFLIDGINGDAAGPDGLVTFRSLEDYVALKVKEYKPIQQPYEGPSDGAIGDFYLAGQPKPEAGRKALVIGIGAYPKAKTMPGAVKDASDMSVGLTTLGFEVKLLKDLPRAEFETAVANFSKNLGPQDIGVFFYSGSGGLCDGRPVMVPSDVSPGEESERSRGVVKVKAKVECNSMISTTLLQANLPDQNKGPLLAIFDMCMTHMTDKAFNPGELARDNIYYLFSAQPGEYAFESEKGGNFTQLLVQAIAAPGASTASLSGRIGLKLKNEQAHQFPYELNGLPEPFFFAQNP